MRLDARTSFSEIGKELKVSPDTVIYRFNKLKKMGIIQGSTVILDFKKLKHYSVNLEVDTASGKEQEVIDYMYQAAQRNGVGLSAAWSLGGFSIVSSISAHNDKIMGKFLDEVRTNEFVLKIITTPISDYNQIPENIDLKQLLKGKKCLG